MGSSIPVESITREVLESEFDVSIWRSDVTDTGYVFYATLDDVVDYESHKRAIHRMITSRLLACNDVRCVSVQSKLVCDVTNTLRVDVSID